MTVRIHFRDLPRSDVIKEGCERLANSLKEEFPETSKFEVSMNRNGEQHETHVHVTGKDLEVASSANDHELQESIVEAFERLRRQLRKHHDKLIHTRRRGASRTERG